MRAHHPSAVLEVDVEEAGQSGAVLRLRGEVDISTAPSLRDAVRHAIDRTSGGITVDLTHVEFVDSVGLGILIGGWRRLKEDGRDMRLSGATGPVRRLLATSGVDRLITVDPD